MLLLLLLLLLLCIFGVVGQGAGAGPSLLVEVTADWGTEAGLVKLGLGRGWEVGGEVLYPVLCPGA